MIVDNQKSGNIPFNSIDLFEVITIFIFDKKKAVTLSYDRFPKLTYFISDIIHLLLEEELFLRVEVYRHVLLLAI